MKAHEMDDVCGESLAADLKPPSPRRRWLTRAKRRTILALLLAMPYGYTLVKVHLVASGVASRLSTLDRILLCSHLLFFTAAMVADHIMEQKSRSWLIEIVAGIASIVFALTCASRLW